MGNEHFWQVPRAEGVYARSITKHARARESSRGATSGRAIAEIGDLDSRAFC